MFQGKVYCKNKTRELALTVLNNYAESGKVLDRIIESISKELDTLSRRDRALLNHLIYGVIRWRVKLDWAIKLLSNKPIDLMPFITLNIMRIGLFQIFFTDRVPNSAAVNTSVELAKKNKLSRKVSGYINGTLRNAIRNPSLLKIEAYKLNKNSTSFLAIMKSFPEWILRRWIKQFGYDATCNLCDTINTVPEIFIRINSLKTNENNLKIIISKEVKSSKTFKELSHVLSISGIIKPINKMKSFLNGMFSVQDAAAQMASHLLSPISGEVILDACAGLGNKSTHMAQLMNDRGRIVAVDNIRSKLKKLSDDTYRLGVTIVETRHLDLEIEPNPKKYPLFDRVMLDAPCSGLGVIRRNPDTKWSSCLKKILNSSKKQLLLLNNVSLLVKPQGVILYVVCSTEPEENEDVINIFLRENSNFKLEQQSTSKLGFFSDCLGKDGFFRTFPHIHGVDGFFMALLKRKY